MSGRHASAKELAAAVAEWERRLEERMAAVARQLERADAVRSGVQIGDLVVKRVAVREHVVPAFRVRAHERLIVVRASSPSNRKKKVTP